MSSICTVYEELRLRLGADNLTVKFLKDACAEWVSVNVHQEEPAIVKVQRQVDTHCVKCEEYTEKTFQAPLGNCDLVMDQTSSGCGCAFHGFLLSNGCPLGKFGPKEEKQDFTGEIQRGMPYSMRRKAIVPGTDLRTVRL